MQDDLHTDWDEAADRVAAAAGADGAVPLPDLKHPIIRKSAEDFPAEPADADIARESISGLSNPVWWKVKIGARWRGAVWEDPETGQAWLCAAGYRREREATDFYKQFMAAVGAKGPEHFLPTRADRDRLARETRATRFDAWSDDIQQEVKARTAGIWDGGVEGWTVPHPSDEGRPIANVAVEISREPIDDEEWFDIVVSVECVDYAMYPLVQWVEMIILTAIDPREQQWSTLNVDGRPTHSQMIQGADIATLRDMLDATRVPATVEPGTVAHYSHKARLAESIVEGEGVKSLCGAWFVPRQDHERLDKCPTCTQIYQALPDE